MKKLTFAGPTNFHEIIYQTIHSTKQQQQQQQQKHSTSSFSCDIPSYTVLVMITDGIISDMEETLSAIIEATLLPISIVMIGVGENRCMNLKALSDKNDGQIYEEHNHYHQLKGFEEFRHIVSFHS
jgi:hypothetical protein